MQMLAAVGRSPSCALSVGPVAEGGSSAGISSPPGSRLGVVFDTGEAGRDRHRGLAFPWQWSVRSWLSLGSRVKMLEVGVNAAQVQVMVMFSEEGG